MSAVIVGAVATVAAAGVSAYSAHQSAKAGSAEEKYGSKVEPEPYDDNVGTQDSYARRLPGETKENLDESLPTIFNIANLVNKRNMKKRDKMTGGAFSETIQQEGSNILAMEKGHIPSDVIDSINKIVAENLGGAFDPTAKGGGFAMSATTADAAHRLGLTSLDIMGKGMAFASAWRSNVDSFLYKPQDAMEDFWLPTAKLGLDASKIQLARDEAEYLSANNIARASAMPNPQVTGAANDALTQGATTSQSIENIGGALAGLLNAYGGTGSGAPPINVASPTTRGTAGEAIPLSTRPPGWNPSYAYS